MTTAKAGATKKARVPVTPEADPAVVSVHEDFRDLTVGQIEEIEDLIDGPLNRVYDQTFRQGKIHRAIAYVVRKATDPDFTYEQSADLKLHRIVATVPVPPTDESGS